MQAFDFGIGHILGAAGMAMLVGRSITGWRAYRHRKLREKARLEAEARKPSRV